MNVCYHYYDGTRRHLTVEAHPHLAKTLVLRLSSPGYLLAHLGAGSAWLSIGQLLERNRGHFDMQINSIQ